MRCAPSGESTATSSESFPFSTRPHAPIGNLAAASETRKRGAFGSHGAAGFRIIQRCQDAQCFGVRRASLDPDRALPRRGQAHIVRQHFADVSRSSPGGRAPLWRARSRRNLRASAFRSACPRFRAARACANRVEREAIATGGADCWCRRARSAATIQSGSA